MRVTVVSRTFRPDAQGQPGQETTEQTLVYEDVARVSVKDTVTYLFFSSPDKTIPRPPVRYYAAEIVTLDVDRPPETRTVVCVWCGQVIASYTQGDNVLPAWELARRHDLSCTSNPLVTHA